MDKRMVGKWCADDATINIFDETPLRMKMSFSSSGYYNFDPNCVYEKDGYLCYEINDEYFRMVYHVRYSDGRLDGFYTQHGRSTPIVYEKVDDVPEDLPEVYHPSEVYVPGSEQTRHEVLQQYAEYDRDDDCDCTDTFVLNEDAPEILEKYGYSEFMNGYTSEKDETVFRILDFVCDHFGHNGSAGMGSGRSIAELVEFAEGNDHKSNCRGLAMLLASLLRLNGIKARHITCMPYEEPFSDCHVVVDCLMPSGKRIMLDPTWRLYLRDSAGEFVSLPHLRELLIAGEPIFENPTADYNGNGFAKEYHRNYMTKNTFRFARCTLHKDGIDHCRGGSRYLELLPKGYPTDALVDEETEFVYNDIEFWKMI